MSQRELEGRSAIITGGATGIGLATAKLMARQGATIGILGHLANDVAAAVDALRADGATALGLVANVADEGEVAAAFAKADQALADPLRILVCNAAIQPYGTVETLSAQLWDEVLGVNLRGAFLASHCAIPLMRKAGGGSVIHVSSVQGSATQDRVAAYSTSKGAMHALTRAMAVDHARDGIRVNSVSPGCIDAPMTQFSARMNAPPGEDRALIAHWGKAQPLGRVGEPEEVAEMIAFLASDRASFCTGSDYRVDGGLMAKIGVVLPEE